MITIKELTGKIVCFLRIVFLLFFSLSCKAQTITAYDMPSPIAYIMPSVDSTYLGILFAEVHKDGVLKRKRYYGIYNQYTHELEYVSDKKYDCDNFLAFTGSGVLTGSGERRIVKFWDRESKEQLWSSEEVQSVIPVFDMDIVMLLYYDTFTNKTNLIEKRISNNETQWNEIDAKGYAGGKYGKGGIITFDFPQTSHILTYYLHKYDPRMGVRTNGGNVSSFVPVVGMGFTGGFVGGAIQGALIGASMTGRYLTPKVVSLKKYDTYYVLTDKLYQYSKTYGLQATYKFDKIRPYLPHQVIRSDNRLYLTEDHLLTCLDLNLQKKWSVTIPELCDHYMQVFADTICIINNGHYCDGDSYRKRTDPYIACFNKKTGALLSLTNIDRKKYTGKVALISLDENLYYLREDHSSFTRYSASKDNFMVILEDGAVAMTDTISGSSVVYNKDQSYLLHFKVNDTICVKREIKTDKKYRGYDFYLTNKEGQILYHFPDGTQNVCYMNNEYYYCIEQQLFCLKF